MYLRSADKCSEILASLYWYNKKVQQDKNTIRQKLFLLARDENYKTNDERKAYSESHPDYVKICDKCAIAESVKKWFDEKLNWFLLAHNLMKAKLKVESQHMISSGISETSGKKESDFGEKEW